MSEASTPCELVRGYRQLMALVPYSRNRLWNMIRAGKFPAPIALGDNAVAWPREEVNAWLASRPRRVPSPKAEAA
jgi:predicted DNA-binding transcriptional regulator AlpA